MNDSSNVLERTYSGYLLLKLILLAVLLGTFYYLATYVSSLKEYEDTIEAYKIVKLLRTWPYWLYFGVIFLTLLVLEVYELHLILSFYQPIDFGTVILIVSAQASLPLAVLVLAFRTLHLYLKYNLPRDPLGLFVVRKHK